MLRSALILSLLGLSMGLMVPEFLKEKVIGTAYLRACMGEKNFMFFHDKLVDTIKECQMKEPIFTVEELTGHPLAEVVDHPELPEPPKAAAATARHHGEGDEHDIEHMIEAVNALKVDKVTRFSNLTCVMTTSGMWNEDRSINMEFWTKTKWESLPEPMPQEFVEHFNQKVEICDKLSDAIPQPKEGDAPFKRMFGKQLFFQHCIIKKKCDLCSMKLMKEMIEGMYGPLDEAKKNLIGLPEDAYEASVVALMAKFQSLPESVLAVKKFLFEGDLY